MSMKSGLTTTIKYQGTNYPQEVIKAGAQIFEQTEQCTPVYSLPESFFVNGPELPAKDSGQPILNTCQITIKDSLSGMVLTLSRKRSSLARIQKLLSGRSSNPDHTKYRPSVCA